MELIQRYVDMNEAKNWWIDIIEKKKIKILILILFNNFFIIQGFVYFNSIEN